MASGLCHPNEFTERLIGQFPNVTEGPAVADDGIEGAVLEFREITDVENLAADDAFGDAGLIHVLPVEVDLYWRQVADVDSGAKPGQFHGEPARSCARLENEISRLHIISEERPVNREGDAMCCRPRMPIPFTIAITVIEASHINGVERSSHDARLRSRTYPRRVFFNSSTRRSSFRLVASAYVVPISLAWLIRGRALSAAWLRTERVPGSAM
jgi:hypothetical protein